MLNLVPSIIAQCLIVENGHLDANRVRHFLNRLPCVNVIGIATTSNEVRDIITQYQQLDIIIIGSGGSNSHAFEIARLLRERTLCMVVVGDDCQSALQALQTGADYFFVKPLHRVMFNSKIRDLLNIKLQKKEILVTDNSLRIPVQL